MNLFEKIKVYPHFDTSLLLQIKQQITWLIASGQLKPDDSLPSVRQLAKHLGINMNTVRSAYQRLELEGLIETRQGLGSRVLLYDPSRAIALNKSLRSHMIGVIIPSLANPFYHLFLQGVEAVTNTDQTLLFMCVTHNDPGEAQRYFAQLAAKHVDGIILASHSDAPFRPLELHQENNQGQSLPLVSVDWPDSTGISVQIDLEAAGYQATRHLLEHGHRRIGLITYAFDAANVRQVNLGYERALSEARIEVDQRLIARVQGFDMNAGAEGAEMLISGEQAPEAIFAITDLMAIGAIYVLQKRSVRIPQDIAIVGFNDIAQAAFINPPLTTVTAPASQMGHEAMKMLQSLIAGKQPLHKRVLLPTSLAIRQSCGDHTPQRKN